MSAERTKERGETKKDVKRTKGGRDGFGRGDRELTAFRRPLEPMITLL